MSVKCVTYFINYTVQRNKFYILSGSLVLSVFASLAWVLPTRMDTMMGNWNSFASSEEMAVENDTLKKSGRRPRFKIKDRTSTRFSSKHANSPFVLKDPKGISTEFRLDSAGKIAVYEQFKDNPELGDYRPAEQLSFKDYQKIQQQKFLRDYWRKYSASLDGQDDTKGRSLLPKIELPPSIDRIFGGSQVEFKPNGNILLDVGYLYQFYDNPLTPVNLRGTGNLNFQEQAQINFQGKIGDKLNLNTNFDTKASFNFQNQLKLAWRSNEEDILQNVEVGNTSWTLNSQLIPGVQNLFGLKTLMRFGKMDVTFVAAQQRSKQDCITLRGGSQGKSFEIRADSYDENRNFFLSTFFRDNYERSLKSLPAITSGVTITRLEVYVTNRTNNTETLRNLVAFSDLGEAKPYNTSVTTTSGSSAGASVDNKNNSLYTKYLADPTSSTALALRQADTTNTILAKDNLSKGTDYEILRGAKRLTDREYRFHPELGYISLVTPLRNDEVLAVSYEYTLNGKPHQVGELTENYQSRKDDEVIIMKLLKSSTIRNNLQHPMWNLMMKNVYSLNAQQINKLGFQLRVIYKDDQTGIDNPNLQDGPLKDTPLVKVFGLDKLNTNGDQVIENGIEGDGNFDYVEGVTIDSKNGRVIFPVLEPFGSFLKNKISSDVEATNKYVFDQLYRLTLTDAQQLQGKNKFFLKGSYQSAGGGEVNLPFGVDGKSVQVTAGGVPLTAGIDYIVEAELGKVRILNAGVSNSSREIKVCYEKPDLFNNQTRTLFGTHIDYILGNDFRVGGTFQHLTESPPGYLRRVQIGSEPVNNTVFGVDASVQRKSKFLTRMLDALPLISTKETSAIDFQGEYATIIPAVNSTVQDNSFIDDFEAARNIFSLNNQSTAWKIGAVPNQFRGTLTESHEVNFKRAKISAYTADFSLYGSSSYSVNVPGINASETNNYAYERSVASQALFPNRSQANNITGLPIGIFDVAYFPSERGMYNFNTDLDSKGHLPNPRANFGAITRSLTSDTDLDNANIETLEFWVMNPFVDGDAGVVRATGNKDQDRANAEIRNRAGGKFVINLGDISEDVIPDGRYNFENGIPVGEKVLVSANGKVRNVEETTWGLAPTRQFVTNAFDLENGREAQDVGLDGLPNNATATDTYFNEKTKFGDYLTSIRQKVTDKDALSTIENDPAGDDFVHYLNSKYNNTSSIILRYKDYMGMENNSPSTSTTGTSGYTEASNQQPDREDLNNDNTINDTDAYYEYELDMKKEKMAIGQNFIVDKVTENGVDWFLVRIPVKNYSKKVGNINGFKSMRFIRMYMTEWEAPVVMRMAALQLSGYNYRKYTGDLSPRGLAETPEPYDANFKLTTVSIEENGPSATKGDNIVPYVVPPGFTRDRDVTTINNIALNEQSMSLSVEGLRDGDARAVFKNTMFDFINYKNLRMFFHTHSQTNETATMDGKVTGFIRIGTDQVDNYYEIETKGLKATTPSASLTSRASTESPDAATEIWPAENEINIPFDRLREVKRERDKENKSLTVPFKMEVEGNNGLKYTVRVVGRPDLSAVMSIMIGVRNPNDLPNDDHQPKTFTVWVDELRASGFDQTSGSAGVAKLGLKLADFANVTMNGSFKTYGFGGVQSKIADRSRENTLEYGIAANINLDKLLPQKWGFQIPMYVSYDRKNITPHFDPLDPDIPLEDKINSITDTDKREAYRKLVEDNTERKGINFSNVRKIRASGAEARPWDFENFTFTYAFSEMTRTSILINEYRQLSHKGGITYAYTSNPQPIEPFKNLVKSSHPMLRWVKDFNFNPLPNSVAIRADMDRSFVKTVLRNSDGTSFEGIQNFTNATPLFEKYWLMTRNYNVGWNLTKSVVLNYTANVNAIIDEPTGDIDTQSKKDSVRRSLLRFGRTKNFEQNFSGVWRLPLNKSPLTDWLTADYSHKFGYTYVASSYNLKDSTGVLFGNILKNYRDRGITGKIDFVALYNRIRALRLANQPRISRKNIARNPGDDEEIMKPQPNFLRSVTRLLMAIRGIQVNYNINETTTLPGFLPAPGLFGMSSTGSAPGFGFVTGSQDGDVRFRASENDWLSKSTVQNTPFVQTKTQSLTYRSAIEPFKDFKIQVEGKWSRSDNYQEFYRPGSIGGKFESESPLRSGNYTMTFWSFLTAFDSNAPNETSAIFNRFKDYRNIIKQRLENSRTFGTGEKYNLNSQDVLIPAFFAAYSGVSPNAVSFSPFVNIPLPNWRLDYNGLANVGWFKRKFSSISVTHSYTSTYSVGNFVSSLSYDNPFELNINNMLYPLSSKVDEQGFLIPVYVMSTITFQEKFGPFVGFNATTKNKISLRLEYAQDRSVGLNLANSQVAELSNKDLTFGMGFTKANMVIPFKVNRQRVKLPNDLKFQMNLTVRDTRTIQRKLDAETVVTNGFVNFQFRPQISYNVSKRMSLSMYFDKMFNNPYVSNTYYRSTIAAGFQVRFSLSD